MAETNGESQMTFTRDGEMVALRFDNGCCDDDIYEWRGHRNYETGERWKSYPGKFVKAFVSVDGKILEIFNALKNDEFVKNNTLDVLVDEKKKYELEIPCMALFDGFHEKVPAKCRFINFGYMCVQVIDDEEDMVRYDYWVKDPGEIIELLTLFWESYSVRALLALREAMPLASLHPQGPHVPQPEFVRSIISVYAVSENN